MNYRMMGRIISAILALEAVFMLPSLIFCIVDGVGRTATAFAFSMLIILVVAGLLFLICRKASNKLYAREGMVCTALSWFILSLGGSLPLWISGEYPLFIDALFESVSGFTTTGATVCNDVEALSRGVLYWRSFSHLLGGMGVLVFLMAILPTLSGGGSTLHLLRAESSGPSVGKLVPKMRKTAGILYIIYLALAVLDFIFLICGGMPVFDAVCTAMGTAGTGGFGIKNDSLASYSPYIQNVCTVFMFIFGVNFSIYYLALLGQFKQILKNTELKFYILLFLCSTGVIFAFILPSYDGVSHALRDAFFQVSSIITSTGFATADFDKWPEVCKAVILMLMMIGACAGSTGGGFKCARVILIFKSVKRAVRRTLHPQKVEIIRRDGETADESVVNTTNVYLGAYVGIIIISTLLVAIDGKTLITDISAVISCVNNIGPGFDAAGPTQSFASFSVLSKIVFIIDMLVGRLEIFPILVLFSKSTWQNGSIKGKNHAV